MGFIKGLEEHHIDVVWHQLKTLERLQFPVGSMLVTFGMMIGSFFRRRVAIESLEPYCYDEWDLIVLAGPTWSYSPSGPVLSLFDKEHQVFKGQDVLPFISCRAYWRMHYQGIKHLLSKSQARALSPVVFSHPVGEPWSTIGVFLKMAGRVPESGKSWLKKFYPKYGHSRNQTDDAQYIGSCIGRSLVGNECMESIVFPQPFLKSSVNNKPSSS